MEEMEIKAKIGECQLELEQLQARADHISQAKRQLTQALIEKMKTSEPEPKPKSN